MVHIIGSTSKLNTRSFSRPGPSLSSFTCVSTDTRVVVIVLHPHRRHHNSANCWLAGLSLRGNARNPRPAVLVAVGDVVPLCEGTAAVARGVRGGRAVHRVTTALLFVVRHAARGRPTENELKDFTLTDVKCRTTAVSFCRV